jgi:hypothetical protein
MHYYTNHGKATLVENVKVTIHFVCEALVQSHIFIRSFNKLFDIMCTYIKNIDYYISKNIYEGEWVLLFNAYSDKN